MGFQPVAQNSITGGDSHAERAKPDSGFSHDEATLRIPVQGGMFMVQLRSGSLGLYRIIRNS